MNRRVFSQMMAAVVASPRWLKAVVSAGKGVRFSFMLWALERQAPFDRCVEIVAEAGYQGIELTGEFQSWSPEQRARIMTRMRSLGVVFDAMSGVKAGFAVPGQREEFRTQFVDHLRAAKELECPTVILLSGVRVDGIGAQVQRQTAIDN